MKLLFLFALSLLVQSGVSETTTKESEISQTTREETTGSGMTPEPCDDACTSDSNCGADGDCKCNAGFIEDGGSCIRGCKSMDIQVNNAGVNKDVKCNDTNYEPETTNINVLFEDTRVGGYSSANVACNETCNNKPRSIGAMKCESDGNWTAPVWTNCSAGRDQSPEAELQDILISTSNAEEIGVNDVQNAVNTIEAVTAGETLPEKDADNAIETINNLLQATEGKSIEEVKKSAEKILDSIENIGTTVVLNTRGTGYNFFENIVSNIALSVVGRVTTGKAFPDDEFFFSLTKSSPNLADAGVVLSITERSGSSYIRAKPTSANGRISFQLYSETRNLFSDLLGNIADGVIFAISGDAVMEFTIKFKIDSNITVTESNNFEQNGKTHRLRAMRWNTNTTTWVPAGDNECDSYSADISFAKVTCNVTGQYSLRTEEIAEPTTKPATEATEAVDPGPSGGEIAGIVVGSLVGVALIVGIVVYCLKFKNKSVTAEGY